MKTGFINEINEIIWEKYQAFCENRKREELKLKGFEGEELSDKIEKYVTTSLTQYKCGCYTLESSNNNQPIETLTVESLEHARKEKSTKTNHMNGFIIDCFNEDFATFNTDIILACMDERTRKAMSKILGQ